MFLCFCLFISQLDWDRALYEIYMGSKAKVEPSVMSVEHLSFLWISCHFRTNMFAKVSASSIIFSCLLKINRDQTFEKYTVGIFISTPVNKFGEFFSVFILFSYHISGLTQCHPASFTSSNASLISRPCETLWESLGACIQIVTHGIG